MNTDGIRDIDLRMTDAVHFLTEGKGRKGLQATVLKPGVYPINPYLFTAEWGVRDRDGRLADINRITEVKPGFVGVIKSALDEGFVPPFMVDGSGDAIDCSVSAERHESLVPVGCRGIWKPLCCQVSTT